jgi:hypothetical protein
MRHDLPRFLFRPISIMVSNVGLVEDSTANGRLILGRIIAFTAYPHRFHIIEALCIFVVFGKVVSSTAGGKTMCADIEEQG